MVQRPQELVDGLASKDSSTRLHSLRQVRNQVIGNKHKKHQYISLGAVRRVVEILGTSGADTDALVQSATTLGSFSYGVEAGARAVLDSNGVEHLLNTLRSSDAVVVEAGARSLKCVYQVRVRAGHGTMTQDTCLCGVNLLDVNLRP